MTPRPKKAPKRQKVRGGLQPNGDFIIDDSHQERITAYFAGVLRRRDKRDASPTIDDGPCHDEAAAFAARAQRQMDEEAKRRK